MVQRALRGKPMNATLDREAAERHAARTDFIWFQSFELTEGVYSPGPQSVDFLLYHLELPESLKGLSVLDIGTSNGAVAFELERRGAKRVVGVDIVDEKHFGFSATRDLLGSRAQFIQSSIYELPHRLHGERFDIVMFLGVLYHLRHPLLALDKLRSLTRGVAFIETAICDAEYPHAADQPLTRFFRLDELGADPTNWFSPSSACLAEWCRSAGFDVEELKSWPEEAPERALVRARATEGEPEYLEVSYEQPLDVRVSWRRAHKLGGRLSDRLRRH
jgi:tRNA (mo5U34)-methyltransferase